MDKERKAAIIGTDKHDGVSAQDIALWAVREWLSRQSPSEVIKRGNSVRKHKVVAQAICSTEAMSYLRLMLRGMYPNAIYEWLRLIIERDEFIQPDALPSLLKKAQSYQVLRPLIVAVMGRQGFTFMDLHKVDGAQWVYETDAIDKPSWRAETDAQDNAMVDTLYSAEQKDKQLDDNQVDHVNGVRYPISDTDMEKYKVDYENGIDPLTQLRELQSDMFKLRGGWSQRLSDVFWERIHRIHYVAERNEHVLKITGFPYALMGGLQHSTYYLHPYEPQAEERVEPLTMITAESREKLVRHINQICDFRRRMITSLSRD